MSGTYFTQEAAAGRGREFSAYAAELLLTAEQRAAWLAEQAAMSAELLAEQAAE